jgi:preprotein translocase subunit Sec63
VSALEIFVIVAGCVFGYLLVDHLMGLRSAKADSAASPPAEEVEEPGWDLILQIPRDSKIDEIRKAYQMQIAKYHPDKVAHLGDEFKEIADRKSQEINSAYADAVREKSH